MKLETVVKLVKDNTNILGYVNAKSLIHEIQEALEYRELRISVVKEPDCTLNIQELINDTIVPVVKAKECIYKQSLDTVYVYSRSLVRLRLIDRAISLINSQIGSKYHFKVYTNYDILNAEYKNEEIS